ARAFVDGKPVGNLTRDNILDNITLYWLTGTGASSARSYWEDALARDQITASGQAPPHGLAPGRLHHLPRRGLANPPQLGRDLLPERPLLQRGGPGRALRRLGRAAAVHGGAPGRLQLSALIRANERRVRSRARRSRLSSEVDERGAPRRPTHHKPFNYERAA